MYLAGYAKSGEIELDKDLKEFLDHLEDKDSDLTIWEYEGCFGNKLDRKTIEKLFTPNQVIFLERLISDIVAGMTFHDETDDGHYKDIREKLNKTEARLRNHRHDHSKNYSGKAEY